jgi:hypothetical protein
MSIDWGNVPAWVATIVTSTSVAVATGSYRRNPYDKEREQASKISCWVTGELSSRLVRGPGEGTTVSWVMPVRVANRSDAPVYDLELGFTNHPGSVQAVELPAGTTGFALVPINEANFIVSPGGTLTLAQTMSIGMPIVTFSDALGRRWSGVSGRLKRVRRSTISTVTMENTISGCTSEHTSTPDDP